LPDIDYDEEEEDEYDSEMDDFIDDEEYDDNGSGDGLKHKKDYSKTIQEIFKYDPKRYKNIKEDDLDDMETNFHSLLKEERMRFVLLKFYLKNFLVDSFIKGPISCLV
jgi:hypothetical protein